MVVVVTCVTRPTSKSSPKTIKRSGYEDSGAPTIKRDGRNECRVAEGIILRHSADVNWVCRRRSVVPVVETISLLG